MPALRRASLTVLSFAVLGLAAGGCAHRQGNGTQPGNPTTAASSTPPTSGPHTSGPPTSVPSGSGRAVVVTGVIERGVEPGCFVLTPDQGGVRYLVLAKSPPPLGVPVVVHGTTSDQLSYCQQGAPLRVDRIDPR